MKTTAKDMGLRIKALREDRGWTQDELAARLGYKSRASVNKIELGKRNLTQSKIYAVAQVFGVSPLYILGMSDPLDEADPEVIAQILTDPMMTVHVVRLHQLKYDHRCLVFDIIDLLHDRDDASSSPPEDGK